MVEKKQENVFNLVKDRHEMINYEQLLKAGVHFGHLTKKWHPKMAPYIFMSRNNIHIIDLKKTEKHLVEAMHFVRNLSAMGKKILFVGTKLQARDLITQEAQRLRMPYVSERWLGGMLTNFSTMRRALRRVQSLDKLMREPAYRNLAKRERLMMQREKDKREKMLAGISELNRLPDALFIVDINKEQIAVQEAQRLNIPIIALLDTNCNPICVDYPIPANDDSTKSIEAILSTIGTAITEGTEMRKAQKQRAIQEETTKEDTPPEEPKGKRIASVSPSDENQSSPVE